MKKLLFFVISISCFVANVHSDISNIWMDMSNRQLSVSEVIEQYATSYNLPEGTELLITRTVEDNIGMTHYTLQQYVNGIQVEGCYLLVHSCQNIVKHINGRILDANHMPQVNAYMSRQQVEAKNATLRNQTLEPVIFEYHGVFYRAYKYHDQQKNANVYLDARTGDIIDEISLTTFSDVQGTADTYYYGTKSIIYDHNSSTNTNLLKDNARNIETYDGSTFYPSRSPILYCNPNSQWPTPYIDSITITWISQDWWYALTDASPDLYIRVKDLNENVLYESEHYDDTNVPVSFYIPGVVSADGNVQIEVLDDDGLGSDDSAGSVRINETTYGYYSWSNSKTYARYRIWGTSRSALTVHWGMGKVYDFYKSTFQMNSYDGKGSSIKNIVNPPDTLEFKGVTNNAAWRGNGIMIYGLGNGISHGPQVTIDVMGHEFTHGVTASNGQQNLPNYGEGGALNESFADIMGNAIKKYALGTTDWHMGTGSVFYNSYQILRSMKNPKILEDPNTYKGMYWIDELDMNKDKGGVHTNCGVQNYWFYLLSEGGNGFIDDDEANGSYSVVGIGIDKAIQIAYRNLMYYITSTAGFYDSRNGSIQAAIDLYGKDSQEHKSVVNAWYAVGVGDAYSEPFTLTPGKYVIVANRDKEGDKNWYYMTSDLGTASNKRFQAVSAETEKIGNIVVKDLEDKYVWELEADGTNWKLKNGNQYVSWASGNTAKLDANGKSLTFEVDEHKIQVHFNDGENERYLSLNVSLNNNYFAFYSGTNQQINLYFLPYEEKDTPIDPQPESKRYVILAQRNAASNWYYMTADLGTASNKRYQAVDAGTGTLSKVNTKNLDGKYYWEIEENKLKTGTQYSSWTSGNTANLDATGKELTIQQHSDGTYTFSFADGTDTRYLAFNATEGNDYFAYYKGTNQIYRLTLVKEGENGPTVDVEHITISQPSAQKILRNGQILILRGDKIYTLQGQEVN